MKFKKGQSGNLSGRPPGALNKTTLIVQKLLASEAEDIARVIIDQAKGGDIQSARLILERVCPPAKDSPVEFKLPKIKTTSDILKAFTIVGEALASGSVTPGQAKIVSDILESHRKALETGNLEKRIEELEKTK